MSTLNWISRMTTDLHISMTIDHHIRLIDQPIRDHSLSIMTIIKLKSSKRIIQNKNILMNMTMRKKTFIMMIRICLMKQKNIQVRKMSMMGLLHQKMSTSRLILIMLTYITELYEHSLFSSAVNSASWLSFSITSFISMFKRIIRSQISNHLSSQQTQNPKSITALLNWMQFKRATLSLNLNFKIDTIWRYYFDSPQQNSVMQPV